MRTITYSCGEFGMEGTRKVLPGGLIVIGGSRGTKQLTVRREYAHELLLPHVGTFVFFADRDALDGTVSIWKAITTPSGRVTTGEWLCKARPKSTAQPKSTAASPSKSAAARTAKSLADKITERCTQIADRIVPEYRRGEKSYSCTGVVAKRWQAAWDGACVALGHDPDRSAVRALRDHRLSSGVKQVMKDATVALK